MNNFSDYKVKVVDMLIDPRYQRDVQIKKVNKIVSEWNDSALGVVTLSDRGALGLYLIDGQHRREAALRVVGPEMELDARIFTGLTLLEEAEMYLDLNNTNQPTALEKFKARVMAEEPEAVAIEQILRSYQYHVGTSSSAGTVTAVRALERVYALSLKIEADPNLVQLVMMTIRRAWDDNIYGLQGVILEGMGWFFAEYGERISQDSLVDRLRELDPGQLLINITAKRKFDRVRASMAAAEIITNEYNKGKKAKRLPAWRYR